MEPEQRAWVAGLLEGEGTFYIIKAHNGIPYPAVACRMTDLDVLKRLQKFTGTGKISGPYMENGPGQTKPCWRWAVQSREPAVALMQEVLPLMGGRRRKKIREVLLINKRSVQAIQNRKKKK